jgi:hypothetical protein
MPNCVGLQSSVTCNFFFARLLLLELPQFYEKRIEYFQPSLQSLIRSQVPIICFQPVLRSRSRWSGNFLVEPEPKFLGLAPAPGM